MLTQFQLRQIRAVRALPQFQQFVNVQGHMTWEHTAATGEHDIDSSGPITVLALLTTGELAAHRIGQRRVIHSVVV
jgi:hypothetical protein